MFPFPSKVIALTPANGRGAAFGAGITNPVSLSAKVPFKLATEHPLLLAAMAVGVMPRASATEAIANVFAKLLCLMIVSFS
jgi:hypothetical protein